MSTVARTAGLAPRAEEVLATLARETIKPLVRERVLAEAQDVPGL